MPRTVSASDAANEFAALVGSMITDRDEIIVESQGEPAVAIIPFAELLSQQG